MEKPKTSKKAKLRHAKMKDVTLDQALKALGDPVRLAAVMELVEVGGSEKPCGTFNYSVTKATFSHHLQILRDAGIVRTRVDGTRKFTSLRSEELEARFPGLLNLLNSNVRRSPK